MRVHIYGKQHLSLVRLFEMLNISRLVKIWQKKLIFINSLLGLEPKGYLKLMQCEPEGAVGFITWEGGCSVTDIPCAVRLILE